VIRLAPAAALCGIASAVIVASRITSPEIRAWETERGMTDDERFGMLYSVMPIDPRTGKPDPRVPADAPRGIGYVPGVPRLGIPAVQMTDVTPAALPSRIAIGATFNPPLARGMGEFTGREARVRGFNVALGGGINLIRDPRGARNSENISEDPWLSGVMGGEIVAGTQSQGVIASLERVSLSPTETNKSLLDAQIGWAAHRESDLLAFQLAIERGQPGTLMCANNKVNGAYACGNDPLLNILIKNAWGYRGWILSDWRAVHGWDFALDGLDQEAGAQLDSIEWFNEPLRDAVARGIISPVQISDMVRRILRSYYAVGIDAWTRSFPIDTVASNSATLDVARQAIVLLKNDRGLLPLDAKVRRVAIIGDHAALGSSPVVELKKLLPNSAIAYESGAAIAAAAVVAKKADVAIVFATRYASPGLDALELSLPNGQDALIEAVAAANVNTVVVLQTGGPVSMPWCERVTAILEAWSPSQFGGQAIAEVLTGVINPSGRLPVTFPRSIDQTPSPRLAGGAVSATAPLSHWYHEGAEVGYRWFRKMRESPLYPFGFGLSYTSFSYDDFTAANDGDTTVSAYVTVVNAGRTTGADVPQLYLVGAPDGRRTRLLGFERVALRPGESRRVSIIADPRLLARYDTALRRWRLDAGPYTVALARAADTVVERRVVNLRNRLFGR